ncbi:hypothetical protein [Tateyamaria pelophila]|uniref:hypothetical protein n=1 Tax=Tateyamaria pelophila TaxID=328415 RepID=UPI001CBD79A2|nr:hypothetical protein [Tateyamaria pelophila]
MTRFGNALAAVIMALPTVIFAQQAINIDQDGTVTISGQLKAGSIQADNLDQALIDLMNEVKGLKSDISALNSKLTKNITDGQWFEYAPNVAAAMKKVNDADVLKFEFGIVRNKGFRELHFSSWNKGLRLMTEPYMTGDGPYGSTVTPYYLGGSLWVSGDALTREYTGFNVQNATVNYRLAKDVCSGSESYHMYYKYKDSEVSPTKGNGCRTEGPVYARKRQFQ